MLGSNHISMLDSENFGKNSSNHITQKAGSPGGIERSHPEECVTKKYLKR